MKLCFVSVNGPRETYFVDEPRIKNKQRVFFIGVVDYMYYIIKYFPGISNSCARLLGFQRDAASFSGPYYCLTYACQAFCISDMTVNVIPDLAQPLNRQLLWNQGIKRCACMLQFFPITMMSVPSDIDGC
jgi:hypothetical protein